MGNRRPRAVGWVLGPLALLAGVTLSACDPIGVPHERDRADVSVEVGADGDAHASLYLPSKMTRAELQRVATRAPAAVFPRADAVRSHIDENDGGYPYVVVDAKRAYVPNASRQFRFDAQSLQTMLNAEHIRKISLSFCGPRAGLESNASPRPDSTEGECLDWDRLGSPAPSVSMDWESDPRR